MMRRDNRIGLQFILIMDGKTRTIIRWGTKSITVNVNIDEMSQRWYNWTMRGDHVQEAFDNLNDGEREFLISGTTPAEWKAMWAEE